MKTHGLLLAALLITTWGCAHLDYAGQSFPRTEHVDLYYSEANVGRAYMVMGELTGTGDVLVSTQKLQDQMVEKAREKGADGV